MHMSLGEISFVLFACGLCLRNWG